MKIKFLLASVAGAAIVSACQLVPPQEAALDDSVETEAVEVQEAVEAEAVEMAETTAEADAEAAVSNADRLAAILAAQPDEVKARYDARHPAETLEFFGIEPGMTVVEALPGGGWYTKILLPYLGPDGKVIGAHYPDEMWIRIIPGATEESSAGIIERLKGWTDRASEWAGEDGAKVADYKLTTLPEDKTAKADAVLFIRALHNLRRTEAELGTFTGTIAETYRIVKPGGIVGVVQHRAAEDTPDEWADGNAGYLKQSFVVKAFEDAGFVLEASSETNANPLDAAGAGDIVWRLLPSLATTEEGTPEQAAMEAIGESDRMTLRFRKPE